MLNLVGTNNTIKNGTVEAYRANEGPQDSYAFALEGGGVIENVKTVGGIATYGPGEVVIRGTETDVQATNYYAVYAEGPLTVTIEDGTFTANPERGSVLYSNADRNADGYVSTIEVSGGSFRGRLALDDNKGDISISGGTFSEEVNQKYCAAGYAPKQVMVGDEIVYVVAGSEGVAAIGDTAYDTVQDAINAVAAGTASGDVVLRRNVIESVTIPVGANVTLDLNGQTLTAAQQQDGNALRDTNAIQVAGGKLTLKDSTATEAPAVSDDYETVAYQSGRVVSASKHAITVYNGGEFVMEGGSVESAGNCGIYVGSIVTNQSGEKEPSAGSATINGGYIHAREYGIGVIAGSSLNYNAGVVVADDNAAVAGNGTVSPYHGGTAINIAGGTLIGHIVTPDYIACGIYHPQDGVLNVTGGTIYADGGVGILMRGGELSVTGGSVTATGNESGKVGDSSIVNGCYGILLDGAAGYYDAANAKVAISGDARVSAYEGVDALALTDKNATTGVIEVSGGAFSSAVPEEYCAEGFEPVANADGTFGVKREGSPEPTPPVTPVDPSHVVTVEQVANGSVSVSPSSAKAGDEVIVAVSPDEGYELVSLVVADADGSVVEVTANADGTWSFKMPAGKVTVTATFACDGGALCPSARFADVDQSQWYHLAIDWAVEEGVLNGYGDVVFMKPDNAVTRAEMAAILYNAEGAQPGDDSLLSDYADVDSSAWYVGSLAWAVDQGLLLGWEDGSSSYIDPEGVLTREQAAAVLMRWAESKGADVSARADLASYPDAADVSEWADECMSWAVAEGVLNGAAQPDGTRILDALGTTTRAQTAALMMNLIEG